MERLQLFESDDVRIEHLYDASSGKYFVPWPQDAAQRLSLLRADPDAWRAAIEAKTEAELAPGIITAIIDTGVLSGHPLLAPRLVGARDFTGEGVEDVNGHGSHIGVLLALDNPLSRILSAKVFGEEMVPYEQQVQRVADGIEWAAANGARLLNLAIGRSGPCRPQEAPICAAVKAALDKGLFVVVAGEARCPAQCDERIITVDVGAPEAAGTTVPPLNVAYGDVEELRRELGQG